MNTVGSIKVMDPYYEFILMNGRMNCTFQALYENFNRSLLSLCTAISDVNIEIKMSNLFGTTEEEASYLWKERKINNRYAVRRRCPQWSPTSTRLISVSICSPQLSLISLSVDFIDFSSISFTGRFDYKSGSLTVTKKLHLSP